MENNKKLKDRPETVDASGTPVRRPDENIIDGANHDDQLENLQANAANKPVNHEDETGVPPNVGREPRDGDRNG
ncbi:hypothetical protein [Pedobacter sp. Leaf176]|uniref:hypothetical protein n=1 Tax=Pedobacter sp. Leaf176 TaxID=1736286 RepID=UPI0006FFF1FE|nr:hypothetical protein [Pedobacter sp. Leaf176]KQR71009.1 hypothetical protein ASF92_06305 [Pedobacter sp. Leaf176]